jgi:molecular chaperone DnaK (HSP70)
MLCERTPGGILHAEEASALVLQHLLDAVERKTGMRPDRAVISVPAYFESAQQEATMKAGVFPSGCPYWRTCFCV